MRLAMSYFPVAVMRCSCVLEGGHTLLPRLYQNEAVLVSVGFSK